MLLPDNLRSLHCLEEQLRTKALELVSDSDDLRLHIDIVERAMDVCDTLRQYHTNDEDVKIIQVLGMRIFNAFGAGLKLILSGYGQNGALIMRDVLETVFLLDLFAGDKELIAKWRLADARTLKNTFSPAAVRKTLDNRYGHTTRKREELYKQFSELAGHPSMKSVLMMRPQKDGDAFIGPFVEKTSLEAVISEMGRLAVQVGQHLGVFFPKGCQVGLDARIAFLETAQRWIATFYPDSVAPVPPATSASPS